MQSTKMTQSIYIEDTEDVEDAKQEDDAEHLEDTEDVLYRMQSKKMMQNV